MQIVLDLPAPPSTNRLWKHTRGHVYLSKEYVNWMKEAGWTMLSNRQFPKERITGPFKISVYIAQSCRGDLDNFLKALLDFLQPAKKKGDIRVGILANDKDCREIHMKLVPTAEAPLGCRVVIAPISSSLPLAANSASNKSCPGRV